MRAARAEVENLPKPVKVTASRLLSADVIVSSTKADYSLTVAGSASGDYALTVMTIVAAIFFPIVLLYQGYTYVVLRRRVGGAPTPVERIEEPRPVVPAE